MKRLIVSLLVSLVVVSLGWYAGIDYAHRGVAPAYALVIALFAGVWTYACPSWRKG